MSEACPTEETLVELVERRLPEAERTAVHHHLDTCTDCRRLVSLIADELPATALTSADPTASTSELAAGTWLPPDRFDEFQLVRRLGAGTMGQVFLARDQLLDREVAVKFIAAVHPSAEARERFRVEARAVARLQHPNVAGVYRMGEAGGRQYLVSEFVRGTSLAVEPRPMPWRRAAAIGLGLAHALDAAHRRGVLHRDIKPSNVIVADDGEVKLLDFGLAKLTDQPPPHASVPATPGAAEPSIDARATLTSAHAIIGTPRYLAPEIWRNQPATERSDIYSLGALLYCICAGRPPHAAGSLIELRREVLAGQAVPLAEVAPDVDPRLADVVDRCLRIDPAERPAGAAAVAAALAALVGDRAPDRPATGRRRPPSRRRVGLLVGGAVVVTAALAGSLALVATSARRQRSREPWRPAIELRTPFAENAGRTSFSPDGRWLTFASNRDGQYRIYVESVAEAEARPVTPSTMRARTPRWTRDGTAVLFECGDEEVCRVDVADGAPRGQPERIAAGSMWLDDCDGTMVVMSRDADRRVWRLVALAPGRDEREVVRLAPGQFFTGIRCDPTGQWVTYGWGDGITTWAPRRGDIAVVALAGGSPRAVTDDGLGNVGPTFAADGRSVIFASRRGGGGDSLWEAPLDGGRPRQLTFGTSDDGPDVSPDGELLVFQQDVTYLPLYVLELDSGVRRKLTQQLGDFVGHFEPTADGSAVVVESQRGGEEWILVYPLDGGTVRTLSPGRLVAVAADQVYVALPAGPSRRRIVAVPLAGGPSRQVAEVTAKTVTGCPGPDGYLHLTVADSSRQEAWRVPMSGGAPDREAEPPWRLVCPAPAGSARFAEWSDAQRSAYDVFAGDGPGAQPTWSLAKGTVCSRPAWDAGGRSLVYACGNQVRRHHLDDGRDQTLYQGEDTIKRAALSADGKLLVYAEVYTHMQRAVITNFAARPRP